jgi:hypothetical protein
LGKVIQKTRFAYRKKNDGKINAFLEKVEERFIKIGGSFDYNE